MRTQIQPKKLSEFLLEKNPDIDLRKAKEIIAHYNDYRTYLRGGKDGLSCFCDVCQKPISVEESSRTGMTEFNYVCNEHFEYINAYNLDLVRRTLGIELNLLFDL